MAQRSAPVWRAEFGLAELAPPHFFGSRREVEAHADIIPQAHLLRRAFDVMDIDGALMRGECPLAYFKVVDNTPSSAEVIETQRKFWNQGIAPILVVVAPDQVHVHTAHVVPSDDASASPPSLVETLERVDEAALHSFVREVETGDYFHRHAESFMHEGRVDQTLLAHLTATRDRLVEFGSARVAHMPVRLLCRTIFTCYLFDRDIIGAEYLRDAGIPRVRHLRDVASMNATLAHEFIYRLFERLAADFNGDVFGELEAEREAITGEQISVMCDFLVGTNPTTGQRRLWPYDFSIIPIELISLIYERFLPSTTSTDLRVDSYKRKSGSFYTPRALAELVLSCALAPLRDGDMSLLDKKFLDPACGSGIFLVGMFHRLAAAWDRHHVGASYEDRLRGLSRILVDSLHGIDKNPSACLIAAFSLYLALLDQLSPRDIRRVLSKMTGKILPPLVGPELSIMNGDFFDENNDLQVDYVIGNPPWTESMPESAKVWCDRNAFESPSQLALVFLWKARGHITPGGHICLVLPHGIFFNHSNIHRRFRKAWLDHCTIESVINLTAFQRFLFDDAEVPAMVVRFTAKPHTPQVRTEYATPKLDWSGIHADMLTIEPEDRNILDGRSLLDNARDGGPPLWKIYCHATPRDVRALERLFLFPRLEELLGGRREPRRRWLIGEGFERYKDSDRARETKQSRLVVEDAIRISTRDVGSLLLAREDPLKQHRIDTRREITDGAIFEAPLVLVNEGFQQVSFAEFNVAYEHGVRGIHGPKADTDLLRLLAAYLRSRLARYFLFHTASSWGVSRRRVDIDDIKLLPWRMPESRGDRELIKNCRAVFTKARRMPECDTSSELEDIVMNYFGVSAAERTLIDDTLNVIEPSCRPSRRTKRIRMLEPVRTEDLDRFVEVLCTTLNRWADRGMSVVGAHCMDRSAALVVLERREDDRGGVRPPRIEPELLDVLARVRMRFSTSRGGIRWNRGVRVFDGPRIYILKARQMRCWTQTAALNDADAIADAIRMAKRGDL